MASTDNLSFRRLAQIFSILAASACVLFGLGGLGKCILFAPKMAYCALCSSPAASLCFLLAGFALFTLQPKPVSRTLRLFKKAASFSVILISLMVLMKQIYRAFPDLDSWLIQSLCPNLTVLAPNGMQEATALALFFLGLALLLSESKRRTGDASIRITINQLFALLSASIALQSLIRYAYEIPDYGSLPAKVQLNAALSAPMMLLLIVANCAVISSTPRSGIIQTLSSKSFGGILMRRLLPAAIIVPFLVGWIVMTCVRNHTFGISSAVAILAASLTLAFATLFWLNSSLLQKLQQEREQRWTEKETFIAVLTHDLKTPLVAASRILELLLQGRLGELNPSQTGIIVMLKKSNEDFLLMIRNLLELYSFDKGLSVMGFQEMDPATIIEQEMNTISNMAASHGVTMSKNIPETLPRVRIDEAAISHVLVNLLHNAIKFTPQGGQVNVEAAPEDGHVVIKIRDSGKGMSEEEQTTLIQHISQGKVGKRYPAGTGLGLYLCYQIVKSQNGFLSCSSILDVGTTFSIHLPVSYAASGAEFPAGPSAPPASI